MLLVIILAIGFWLRWRLVTNDPLVGDMIGYDQYAKAYNGLYRGTYCERDPFFIALLHYWQKVSGDHSPAAYRALTVALSMCLVTATSFFVLKLSDDYVLGIAAACLMALHPAWIRESARGLRTELLTLELLAVLSIWLWLNNWYGAILLGVALGLMALTQKKMAFTTLNLFLWATIPWSSWSIEKTALAWLLMNILYLPHEFAMNKLHGKGWAEDRTARFFTNSELNRAASERAGALGYYQGPPMTWSRYYFE